MDFLYAPWRSYYKAKTEGVCVFCKKPEDTALDESQLVLKRYKHCYVMLNLFPYNAGHLLIVPYAHVAQLYELDEQQLVDLMFAMSRSTRILHDVLSAEGINVGSNLGGKAAGGSIPHHVHMHAVPRWSGDTNFLSVIGKTKSIAMDLKEVYQALKKAYE